MATRPALPRVIAMGILLGYMCPAAGGRVRVFDGRRRLAFVFSIHLYNCSLHAPTRRRQGMSTPRGRHRRQHLLLRRRRRRHHRQRSPASVRSHTRGSHCGADRAEPPPTRPCNRGGFTIFHTYIASAARINLGNGDEYDDGENSSRRGGRGWIAGTRALWHVAALSDGSSRVREQLVTRLEERLLSQPSR